MNEPVRILIVEDNAADAELAKREISKMIPDCTFQLVETRKDFLEAIKTFQPDLILSDYKLPSFDGRKALALALKHAPLTPFVIWTGSLSEDVAVECMKAGASNYILKENIKRLGPAVAHALDERRLQVERKQAEEALVKSERRFRALIEHGRDNISLLDAGGTLLWESPATDRTLGYSQDQFVGHTMFELVHPDDLDRVSDLYARLVHEPGSLQQGSFRLQHASGTWRWVEATVTNLLNEPGVEAIVVNYRDITERKQAEEKLRESENRLFLALAGARMGVWEWDMKTNNIYLPSEYFEMMGAKQAESRGRFESLTDLIHPEDIDRVRASAEKSSGK